MKWDKTAYPPSEGWIKMDATLTRANVLTEEQIKRAVTLGNPQNSEFGPIEQKGKRLSVILRDRK